MERDKKILVKSADRHTYDVLLGLGGEGELLVDVVIAAVGVLSVEANASCTSNQAGSAALPCGPL